VTVCGQLNHLSM